MLKRYLLGLVLACVCSMSQNVFSQDIFFSFSPNSVQSTTPATLGFGTAYLFASPSLAFDAADINITSSNPNLLQLTGGAGIDDPFITIGGTRFNTSYITVDASTNVGRWFAVNVTQNGISPPVVSLFDPNFVPGVGSKLAEVDYLYLGGGDATLGLSLGTQGVLELPNIALFPVFGSATVTDTVQLGDVNLDGDVDFFDMSAFIAVLSGRLFQAEADCDENGTVDFLDIKPFISILRTATGLNS